MAFPDPMDKVRIRLQGREQDIKKVKKQLERSFAIKWGFTAQDLSKKWANTPNVPTGKIRSYGVIQSMKPRGNDS